MKKNSKKKPDRIWICKCPGISGWAECFFKEPMEYNSTFEVWVQTSVGTDLCADSIKAIEYLLGEKLPEHPKLAEITLHGFKILHIWEPIEEEE